MALDDRLGERCDVAKAEVEALAGERVDEVGRVADEREALGDETARHLEAEREPLDPRGERDLAELRGEAERKLAQEILGVERDERARLRPALVPDDARAPPRQRQDGEGARGQEVLFGDPLVLVFVGDRRDDAQLVVIPAIGRDLGERPELRARAVGGDGEAGAHVDAPGEPEFGDMAARPPAQHGGGEAGDAEPVAQRRELGDDVLAERHMGERLPGPASNLRCGRRTASRTPPSMMSILRIGCELGATASQAPIPSRSRRGPGAIATARSGASRAFRAGLGAGSTTATAAPSPSACLTAAARARPVAAPPAMTTSKTGTDLVTREVPERRRIVRRLRPGRNVGGGENTPRHGLDFEV